MIHMMTSELKYQHGQRNNFPPFMEQAFAHYKYSLTRFNELMLGRSLQDIQAMLLIAVKLRNFPKPGAAWMCSQLVMNAAVETNLHRSADRLPEDVRKGLTAHQKELRKRVFWTAYSLTVALGGKLGIPVTIRLDDIDIEMPEPVSDIVQDDSTAPEEPRCSFHIGIAMMKHHTILARMYSNILGIRRNPRTYATESQRLEADLQKWKASLPAELSDLGKATREWKLYALFVQFWILETRFLIFHPVIHSQTNPDLYGRNAKICLEISSDILSVVQQIHDLKALDIPWINMTTYLASIFTTLFIYDQRQDDITQEELQKLQAEMLVWIDIFKDAGRMLGKFLVFHHVTA